MTDHYAVIGNPIGHSKSPLIHRSFAAATGEDIDYVPLEAPVGGFATRIDAFRAAGGLGLNITTPFKLDAFAYATERRPRAERAGAVNCLKFEGANVIAENFDGVGLVNDIQQNHGCPMAGRRVLMLGAGGAVRGALLPILEQGPAQLVVVNRTLGKAEDLVAQFSSHGHLSACDYPALAGEMPFDVVINGTSASLRGELPPIAAARFAAGGLAYEMVYGKGLTPFLRATRQAGMAQVADGVGMLVEQAVEAFAWWRGIRPDGRPLIKELTIPLT